MEAQNIGKNSFLANNGSSDGEFEWTGRDLNPRLPPCEAFSMEEIDWNEFKRFLSKSCSEKTAGDRIRYAKKYGFCLANRDFSVLNSLSDSKRTHSLKALSLLSKFLGVYDDFRRLKEAYGLKWRNMNAEELILSRMQKTRENGSVINWVKEVKVKLPLLEIFMDFYLISGLRFNEAIKSYDLIIELSAKGDLDRYYDNEKQVLEHYRFKSLFIRRTKKVFLSYVPDRTIRKICRKEKLSVFQVVHLIRRKLLQSRFGDVREYFASFMTGFLNPAEIDFLQGRVSTSVFMRNYFNPALIKDFGERAFKGINELQAKIGYVDREQK
jgi:intergrase/recombinase